MARHKHNPLVLFWLLVALPLAAQSVLIDAGSANEQYFAGDPALSYKYPTATSPNAFLASQGGVYRTMRAGSSIKYDVPVLNGTCVATFDFIEPRLPGGGVADIAVGKRVFSIVMNGVRADGIDIFGAAGSRKPYTVPLGPAIVSDGHLRIEITALPGSLAAIVSGIEIVCTPPPSPIACDATGCTLTGDLHVKGNVTVEGFVDIGKPGTPTKFVVTRSDGTTCTLSFTQTNVVWTC